ncbi:response regulator [Tundrisphaera sp. TA3]|uniref:response regulator n=1 Tax=Tundrisphaera sp. TA3 TaxID=3435775 RepID=UPI003EBD5625
MNESLNVPVPEGPAGLLLSRDLIFTSKVTGTASALGHKVIVAGNVALASAMLGRWTPVAVFADLAAGDLVAPANLARFRELIPASTPFLAFGSHVDTDALASARAAGCDPVMPRSKFTLELPELIRTYFAPRP